MIETCILISIIQLGPTQKQMVLFENENTKETVRLYYDNLEELSKDYEVIKKKFQLMHKGCT